MHLSQEQFEGYITPEFKDFETQNCSVDIVKSTSLEVRTRVFLAYNWVKNLDAGAAFALSIDPEPLTQHFDSGAFHFKDIPNQHTYFFASLSPLALSIDKFMEIEKLFETTKKNYLETEEEAVFAEMEILEQMLMLVTNKQHLEIIIDLIKAAPNDRVYYNLIMAIYAKNLQDKEVVNKIEELVSKFRIDELLNLDLLNAIALFNSGKVSKKIKSHIHELINLDQKCIDLGFAEIICRIITFTQDKSAIPLISKYLKDIDTEMFAKNTLLSLGVSSEKIENIKNQAAPENTTYNYDKLKPYQQAAYKLLTEEKTCKRIVFDGAKVLDGVQAKQEFITIHTPELAQKAYECLLRKLGSKTNGLVRILKDGLGLKLKNVNNEIFTYFADEILDLISNLVKGTEQLREDSELARILAEMIDTDGVKIRYITRNKSDLSLGDKCGDCTAKGSVNHNASILWNLNPAYQIATIEEGKSFIGRVNLTLGYVDNKPALIVDAHEFNPQSQKDPTFKARTKKAYAKTIELLKKKAKAMNREFHFSTISNSSGSEDFLKDYGQKNIKPAIVQLLDPEEDLQKILARKGYKGDIPLFYQLALSIEEEEVSKLVKNQSADPRIQKLEALVLNPAQIDYPEIASAMRERSWKEASILFINSPELTAKIKAVYNLPANISVGPEFVEKKLIAAYPEAETRQEDLLKIIKLEEDMLIKID